MKLFRDEDGQMLVVVVLAMGMLLAFMALAFDVGQFFYVKRQVQTAADAAALAGALEVPQCSTGNCATMQTAASKALSEDGFTGAALTTQCAATTSNLILELNNGPCALSNDPHKGDAHFVEAVVTFKQPTFLARLLGMNSVNIVARGEAGMSVPTCAFVTDPTAASALTVGSSGSLNSACGINVNSNSPDALNFGAGSTITANGAIDVNGGAGLNHGNPSPEPTTGTPMLPDPFARLQNEEPAATPCGASTASPYTGANGNISVNPGTPAQFNPGVYCGGINFNGTAAAVFNPGTYVFVGAMNVGSGSISNNTSSGSGVTFYFSSGSLTMNSAGHANLTPETTGPYAGVLMFQSNTDNTPAIINSDSTSVWQGAIYLPDAPLTINGQGNAAAFTILDVKDLTINGTFNIGDNFSSLPGGPPIPISATLTE